MNPLGIIILSGVVLFHPVVVLPQINSAALRPVSREGKWGYVNKRWKVMLPLEFDLAGPFSEGLAYVRRGNKWGYINESGKEVINAQFEDAGSFSQDRAAIRQGGKWGYIDPSGNFVISPRFDGPTSASRLAHLAETTRTCPNANIRSSTSQAD